MGKVAFVFPGQGSQYVGMGKALCEEHDIAVKLFEEANSVLGFDLMKLVFEGSIDELTETEHAQAAILTHSVAAFQVFMKEHKVEPAYLLGHSLGEITALTCAGAIAFQDAVRLVYQRGRFMQEAAAKGVGAMASIQQVDRGLIEQECERASVGGKIAVVSNYNSPHQTVISGHRDIVANICKTLEEAGGIIVPLQVSAPFHSPLMDRAVSKFREVLSKQSFDDMKWPVLSNVTATPYTGRDAIAGNLAKQMVSAVRWQDSIEFIQKQRVTWAIEFGPGKVLRNLIQKCTPSIRAFSYDITADRKSLEQEIRKSHEEDVNLRQKNLAAAVERCMTVAVCTKNYNSNNEEYHEGVIVPYRTIKQVLHAYEQDGTPITIEKVNEALQMLKSVFSTKRTPTPEQAFRFDLIRKEMEDLEICLDWKESLI